MEIKIGTTLKMQMKKQGLTLKELSGASGVPSSTLGEWVNNRPPRNPIQVKRVAETLGVSMHYLYFGFEEHTDSISRILKEDLFSGTFEINIRRVNIKEDSK